MLLVTGKASPQPLKKYQDENSNTYNELTYSDHHIFTIDDLKSIIRRFKNIQAPRKIILTTEKDAVRLVKFEQQLKELPFYIIPMEMAFLFNGKQRFTDLIVTFITDFHYQS